MYKDLSGKAYRNKICKLCIQKNREKYNLAEGEWKISCEGISYEDEIKLAISEGFSEEEARWMFDPAYLFKKVYNSEPRWYQNRLLYCTSNSLAGRQCRQTGKTLIFMYKIFHYVTTNENKTALIVTPMEAQIKKIWDEYIFRDFVYKNDDIKRSVVGKTQAPFYQITFDNGSKIILMIAGPAARSQSADLLYVDEAALIPKETLNDIIMTLGSKSNPIIYLTSTPKGRGNLFYDACQTNPEFNEYHVSIEEVDEIKHQIPYYKRILGETGYQQECLALFPDISGGPFSYRGIDLAKYDYYYQDVGFRPGMIYIGGVDWNGPAIGTYFNIIEFDPENYKVRIVDSRVVSSAEWNSTVAKEAFILLHRKWRPKHWMVDSGYGHSLIEEILMISKMAQKGTPEYDIKFALEPVEFGSFLEMEDPFTKEINKKMTKPFIVTQFARLLEPQGDTVPLMFSKYDEELIKSLENYKLLQVTDRGIEKYGFDKKDGIEDHKIDSVMLACWAIPKYYGELFKKMLFLSVSLNAAEIYTPKTEQEDITKLKGYERLTLITDSHSEPIYLDEKKKYFEEEKKQVIISRGFSKQLIKRSDGSINRRSGIIKRTMF